MAFEFETFPAGPIDTNAYLLIDTETNDAVVVDAPFDVTEAILAAVGERGVTVRQIVLTHAHWDHIGDAAQLQEATGASLVAHPLAKERLASPASVMLDLPFEIPPSVPDSWLDEGDAVEVGGHRFEVMYLPGHDPAHIVLYSPQLGLMFGGDVVFPNGHGRIDIPGASESDMAASLARVAALPMQTVVYPGHGLPATLRNELWLQSYRAK